MRLDVSCDQDSFSLDFSTAITIDPSADFIVKELSDTGDLIF